jgi:hypothetical protein
MWDDDFSSKKKFELGRVIERDLTQAQHSLNDLNINDKGGKKGKENHDRGRVVKTTDIDFFLNCDNMSAEEI